MRRRRTGAPRRRRRQRGAALVVALLTAGLLLASNVVSLETFVLTLRAERSGIDRMVDFHLADTMLTLCERRVARAFGLNGRGHPPVGGFPASSAATNPVAVLRGVMAWTAEPTRWRDPRAFGTHGEPPALRIVLPAALAAPRRNVPLVCLVETWVDVPEVGQVLLLTARVPAAPGAGSGTWLQSVVMLTALGMQRHWRAVAEPPAPAF
ncbi:MAG: hypothetical protein ACRYHA_13020 [Janthinobacterium lividum]